MDCNTDATWCSGWNLTAIATEHVLLVLLLFYREQGRAPGEAQGSQPASPPRRERGRVAEYADAEGFKDLRKTKSSDNTVDFGLCIGFFGW